MTRAGVDPPAVSTIHQTLVRNRLVAAQPPRPPRADKRFEREISNDLWQIDATQIGCADDTKAWVVDLLDDHSRYLLAALAGPAATGELAWDAFETGLSAPLVRTQGRLVRELRLPGQANPSREPLRRRQRPRRRSRTPGPHLPRWHPDPGAHHQPRPLLPTQTRNGAVHPEKKCQISSRYTVSRISPVQTASSRTFQAATNRPSWGTVAAMTDRGSRGTRCGSCGRALDEAADLPVEDREPCHRCGSTSRMFHVELQGSITATSTVTARLTTQQGQVIQSMTATERELANPVTPGKRSDPGD